MLVGLTSPNLRRQPDHLDWAETGCRCGLPTPASPNMAAAWSCCGEAVPGGHIEKIWALELIFAARFSWMSFQRRGRLEVERHSRGELLVMFGGAFGRMEI